MGSIVAIRIIQAFNRSEEGSIDMPFNPNLINPDTDEEIYANASPTLGTLMLARYSTPLIHHKIIYSADCSYFFDHPGITMYLRRQFAGEFDNYIDLQTFDKVPTLWVLVANLGVGYHERTPRFRGSRFWKEPESNDQLAQVLIKIAEREGMNLSDWYGYVVDQRTEDSDERKKAN